MSGCSESHTSETWLDINNYVNSKLCVLVTSKARCGSQTLRSRPLAEELTNLSLVVPEVENLTLIDAGPDYFTVSWTKPSVSFDYYWMEVQYISGESDVLTPHRVGSCANGTVVHRSQTQITCDKFKECANRLLKKNQGRSGVGGLSAGSCAGGITVDANQTSVTCGNIEACSVRVTVRTHRSGPLELTSSGVTVHDIIMSEKDVPEVLPTLEIARDSFVLRWNRPSGCFDKYILEVTYHDESELGLKRLGGGFCAGTTILDPDLTNVTCAIIPACANASMVLRTQRNGRTSRGEALHKYFDSAVPVDFEINLETLNSSAAQINVHVVGMEKCGPVYCRAIFISHDQSGLLTTRVLPCSETKYRNEWYVSLSGLSPGKFLPLRC
ncbi:hypothetical protein MTO96_023568 [Rhipicephalus appendiculatus]